MKKSVCVLIICLFLSGCMSSSNVYVNNETSDKSKGIGNTILATVLLVGAFWAAHAIFET